MSIDQKLSILLLSGESRLEVRSRLAKFVDSHPDWTVTKIETDKIESIREIGSLNGGVGFFQQNEILVLQDVLSSKLRDDFLDYLHKTKLTSNLKLVFYEIGKADKRSKLYKYLKKNEAVIEYPPPKASEIKLFVHKYLKTHQLEASNNVKKKLANMLANSSLDKLHSELEKLRLLLSHDNRTNFSEQDLELIVVESESQVWSLLDKASQDKAAALKLLKRLIHQGTPAPLIVGFLSSALASLFRFYHKPDSLNSFQKRQASLLSRNISCQKLEVLIEKLAELDIKLKSEKLDDRLALCQYLILV